MIPDCLPVLNETGAIEILLHGLEAAVIADVMGDEAETRVEAYLDLFGEIVGYQVDDYYESKFIQVGIDMLA